jgi:hypothetical protein
MEGSLGRLITAGYTIIDRDTPNLSIEGDRAILAVEQSYLRTPQSPYGLSYSHRFVLEHDVESNNRLPGSVRQWRIVKSEFGTSQVLKENGGEIY